MQFALFTRVSFCHVNSNKLRTFYHETSNIYKSIQAAKSRYIHCKNSLVKTTNLNWLSQMHLFTNIFSVKTTKNLVILTNFSVVLTK